MRSQDLLVVYCLCNGGCGSGLDLAPIANEPKTELVDVSTAPPAALPELIPKPPSEYEGDLVWADGCWHWTLGRWVWVRGGWVDLPPGAEHFPGRLYVTVEARMLWRPCEWVVNGKTLAEGPKTVAPALFPKAERSVEDLYR